MKDMSWFWTYETELPADAGFALYGWQHILWMGILVSGIICILHIYKKMIRGFGLVSAGEGGSGSSAAARREDLMRSGEEGHDGETSAVRGAGSAWDEEGGRARQAADPMLLAGEEKCLRRARRIRFGTAFAALFLQVIQAVYRIALGVYDVGTLPLHICSIASYAVFLHCLLRKPPKWFSEILFFPLLPGAMCAIVFPDWTHYPAFSFMSCAGFLVHGSIVLYVFLRMADGTVCPSPARAWAPALFLADYACVMIPFDRHFNVNYGFLAAPSPGSPLMFIADVFGTGAGYLFGFGLLVFAVMAFCYSAEWVLTRRR